MLEKYSAKNWPVGQLPAAVIVKVRAFDGWPLGLRTMTDAVPAANTSMAGMCEVAGASQSRAGSVNTLANRRRLMGGCGVMGALPAVDGRAPTHGGEKLSTGRAGGPLAPHSLLMTFSHRLRVAGGVSVMLGKY